MTDQIQEAKEWLGDINVILSNQKTKEDYEYGKKRADALQYLINRVEDLESAIATGQHVSNLMQKKIERYKQALEDLLYSDDPEVIRVVTEALKGVNQNEQMHRMRKPAKK
ncbi:MULTISPECIES: hypothetical protein [unclassified Oceanobacillus]|uniref:hypothetical protein n=1 Tax=unclassified Oceanobacillus TaxID=2630292 RepID=UPI00300DE49B